MSGRGSIGYDTGNCSFILVLDWWRVVEVRILGSGILVVSSGFNDDFRRIYQMGENGNGPVLVWICVFGRTRVQFTFTV